MNKRTLIRTLSAAVLGGAAASLAGPADYGDDAYWAGYNAGYYGDSGQSPSMPAPNPTIQQGLRQLQNGDASSAMRTFQQAAMAGDPQGALHLGIMNYNGEGIPPNPAEAYLWYRVAARGGIQIAESYAHDAARLMTPQQRQAAENRLAQFSAQPPQNPNRPAQRYQAGGNPPQNSATQASFNDGGAATGPARDVPGQRGFSQQGYTQPQGMPGPQAGQAAADLQLEQFDAGFFSILKPRGWQIYTTGSGVNFGFVMRDPNNPARQAFGFGQIGPVFADQSARQQFVELMAYGQVQTPVDDLPVIGPITPANLLMNIENLVRTRAVQQTFPQAPQLAGLRIVSSQPHQSPMNTYGGTSELLWANFTERGIPAEGFFMLSTSTQPGMPGCGWGSMFYGITAPTGELAALQPVLQRCLDSGQFSQQYVSGQRQLQDQQFRASRNAARTYNEISDMQADSWNRYNRATDIASENFSDAIRGNERLWDPSTGQVYQFENGFYDSHYDLNRDNYEMNNLQQLPWQDANYNQWMDVQLNGYEELR